MGNGFTRERRLSESDIAGMDQKSSRNRDGQRRNRSGGQGNASRNRNRNRNRNRSGGGRQRRPEPKPTGIQKFVKAVTFGLVDPTKKKRKAQARKQQRNKGSGERRRKSPIVEPTTPKLYVGNLDYGIEDHDLEQVFSKVGKVESASVVRRGDSGRSKGFAFVVMGSVEEAKKAVSSLNDTDLKGRLMLVTGAKSDGPKEGGPSSDRGGDRPRRERRDRSERSGDRSDRRERSGGRGERREGGRRERGERGERGDRKGRSEKATRQVRPLEIEQVSSPVLLVQGINNEATDVDLADLYEGIGTVANQSLQPAKEGSDTVSYVVEFSETAEAQRAVEFLDGKAFMGNQLKVTAAPDGAAGEGSAPGETAPAPEEAAAVETPEPESAVEESAAEDSSESTAAVESTEEAPAAEETEWSPSSDQPEGDEEKPS